MSTEEKPDPAWLLQLIEAQPTVGQIVKGQLEHERRWRDEKIARQEQEITGLNNKLFYQKRIIVQIAEWNERHRRILRECEERAKAMYELLADYNNSTQGTEGLDDQDERGDAPAGLSGV